MSQKNKNEKHSSKFFKTRNVSNENGDAHIGIVLDDEEDPCAPKKKVDDTPIIIRSPGHDPR